ncbi:MAG: prepilin peptidase [Phycisphaeraceae bacterium]
MVPYFAYIAIVSVCLAASVTDVRTGRIPNKLTASAMLGGLVFWLAVGLVEGRGLVGEPGAISGTLGASFLTMLCGLVPFAMLVLMGGLGGGDMKLMGAIGAWSAQSAWGPSWRVVLDTTIYALFAAALIGVVVMIRHKRVRLTLTRVAGIAATRGKAMQPDDDGSALKVPFAVAAAAGIVVAGAEHLLGLWPPLLGGY